MSSAPTMSQASVLDRWRRRWWALVDRAQRPAVVANLVGQVVIVVTGGAVRLTASGLGCSTWPACYPGSFTPQVHDATSFHPFVEFGNRTVAAILVVLAVAVLLLAGLDRRRPTGYRALAFVPFVGVLVQAVIGGITVLIHLNPAIVAGHFLLSMVLVAASAWLLVRTREGDAPPVPTIGRGTRRFAVAAVVVAAFVLALGTVVTGAGPHSGDNEVGYRFAVDPLVMAHVHAAAVWAFVALLALTIYGLQRAVRRAAQPGEPAPGDVVEGPSYVSADGTPQPARGFAPVHPAAEPATTVTRVTDTKRALNAGYVTFGVTAAQGVIGYTQVATGLPIALVNLHMLGAALLVVALVLFLGTLRRRGPAPLVEATTSQLGLPDAAAL